MAGAGPGETRHPPPNFSPRPTTAPGDQPKSADLPHPGPVAVAGFRENSMQQRIVGFHQDEEGHWVADLECGHTQHTRHDPPWQNRPWVTTPEGRSSRLGTLLNCPLCDASRAG